MPIVKGVFNTHVPDKATFGTTCGQEIEVGSASLLVGAIDVRVSKRIIIRYKRICMLGILERGMDSSF